MKNKTSSVCLAVCLGLSTVGVVIGVTGCAGDRYNRSTGESIDDNMVKMHVSSALSDNPEYKFEDVKVLVFKGTVQLSGFVNLSAQKSKAGEIARQVQGVRTVENNITVKEKTDRSSGQQVDDKSLASRVNSALNNNPEYKFDGVKVTALQGTVQLSGFVNTSEQKSRARDIAKQVEGVKEVQNNITVKDKLD